MSVSHALRSLVERLGAEGALPIRGEVVSSHPLTLAVYGRHGFQPLWTDERASASLLLALAELANDGLDPERYHLSVLRRGAGEPLDAGRAAELDVLRTDALVRARHDLRFGRTEPLWNVVPRRPWPEGDSAEVADLIDAVRSGDVYEALTKSRPDLVAYATLRGALARLRAVQEGGGWRTIPSSGPPLRRGEPDERVPLIRRRLALEGDLEAPVDEANVLFDPALEEAVRRFQRRRGLQPDGVVGESTLAAMNVPVEALIDRLRVNLERLRWIGRSLPDTFVHVDVAGAVLQLVARDRVVFETRAIVGAEDRPTPVFAAEISHVTLNPAWIVPPGMVEEVLAAVRKDAAYLRNQGMRLLDAGGREVDPDQVDFSRYTGESFPYRIRQDAGPSNPLGRIRFDMPNRHHVYIHDTPARHLFERERRSLSHGCVRVESPLELAERLLLDPARWNRATLAAAIATEATRTIPLPSPVPVLVLYWTATAGPDGRPHYYPDVYGRDADVLAALDADGDAGTRSGSPR